MTLPNAAAATRRTRVYRREVPREWDAALAQAYPRKPGEAWPILVWEPGYDYVLEGNDYDEVVERWMLYNMIDVHQPIRDGERVSEWHRQLIAELEGPAPESLRQVIPMPQAPVPNTVRVISGTGVVNQRQWELYRQTGRYGVPIWCVQGEKGGTPMEYPLLFQKRAQVLGLPIDPPMPGTLPYADFDQRTLAALEQYVRIKDRSLNLSLTKRMLGVINQKEAREAVALTDRLLLDQVAETADYVARATKDWDLPIATHDPQQEMDKLHARREAEFAARTAL